MLCSKTSLSWCDILTDPNKIKNVAAYVFVGGGGAIVKQVSVVTWTNWWENQQVMKRNQLHPRFRSSYYRLLEINRRGGGNLTLLKHLSRFVISVVSIDWSISRLLGRSILLQVNRYRQTNELKVSAYKKKKGKRIDYIQGLCLRNWRPWTVIFLLFY